MYEVSEAFHRQYADMYDKFVRIHFKDALFALDYLTMNFMMTVPFLSVAR